MMSLQKLLKDIFGDIIYQIFNYTIDNDIFPKILKTLIFLQFLKKQRGTVERATDLLVLYQATISKIYERCIYRQMSKCFDEIQSKHQCGFINSQHCLACTVEKWREAIDSGGCLEALLTDLMLVFYMIYWLQNCTLVDSTWSHWNLYIVT